MIEVESEIRRKGTYKQSYDELNYACKVGWRNAPRCINRIQWSRMEIIDCRDVTTAEVFLSLINIIYYLFICLFILFLHNVRGCLKNVWNI